MQQRSKNQFVNYAASIFFWGTVSVLLSACATGFEVENHGFGFDARWDSPNEEILDYQYGNSRQPNARADQNDVKKGSIRQYLSMFGEILRGDFLYVKWRNKTTGKIYEDTVDLRNRLPSSITNHNIRFIVKGSQLYVFLISPKKLQPNPCGERSEMSRVAKTGSAYDMIFSRYCSQKISQIYPDSITRK